MPGTEQTGFLILLDSASAEDAKVAATMGIVAGITTNPILMSRESLPPLEQLSALLAIFPGPIFYQPATPDVSAAADEVRAAHSLAPDRVIAKLPARLDLVGLAAALGTRGIKCALTAVYSPGQALLAAAARVDWIIPYVNRARRLAPDGERLVAELSSLLAATRTSTRILAASIKSADEAIQSIRDGAHAISAPLQVLRELDRHQLTESAIDEFARFGIPRPS